MTAGDDGPDAFHQGRHRPGIAPAELQVRLRITQADRPLVAQVFLRYRFTGVAPHLAGRARAAGAAAIQSMRG